MGDGSSKWPIEVEIDMWQFASVKKFMAERNVTEDMPTDVIREYLPQLKVRYNPRYAAGALGEQATTGYVVMCLDSSEQHRTASWMVVMKLTGEVVAVTPTPGYGVMGKVPVQMNALKMRDPHRVLLGANLVGDYGSGPVMLYDWVSNSFEVICNGSLGILGGSYSSHDIQWVSSATYDTYVKQHVAYGTSDAHVGGGHDRVWRPSTTLNLMYAVDTLNGKTERILGPLDYQRTSDMNHFQILEGGYAVINGRSTGSWRKVEMQTGNTVWTCGGAFGNFTLIDIDGNQYPGGASVHEDIDESDNFKSLWFGQHNLEYFGEDENGHGVYFMFNNNYNQVLGEFLDASSRPMRVVLDEEKLTATVTWQFETGVHSFIYGDADLLPTGNVLATYWPDQLTAEMPEQYDQRVVEIVPGEGNASDELAWELLIIGENCTIPAPRGCARAGSSDTVPMGWSMYSVERFYEAPLAIDAAIVAVDGSDGTAQTVYCTANDSLSHFQPVDGSPYQPKATTDSTTSTNLTTKLTFSTYDSFKSSLPSQGHWWLERKTASTAEVLTVGLGQILFNAHWRKTTIEASVDTIDVAELSGGSGYTWALVVSDQWGYQNRTVHLACN